MDSSNATQFSGLLAVGPVGGHHQLVSVSFSGVEMFNPQLDPSVDTNSAIKPPLSTTARKHRMPHPRANPRRWPLAVVSGRGILSAEVRRRKSCSKRAQRFADRFLTPWEFGCERLIFPKPSTTGVTGVASSYELSS